ncbi:MAG: class I SAM-dependent methyltransferase [Chloroflexi bacterium]|nr:class I SAM-dependent methyltransferase [Chloroflexota bacterium]
MTSISDQVSSSSPAWWDARYRASDARWDTGIVPPEVVALVASGVLIPGWALDLGCGPGVSSRYLARHGFRVIGVDLSLVALRRANAAAVGAPAFFCAGDVADLGFLRIQAAVALDIGCFHSLPPERRADYIASLAAHLLPGACYLLYAFAPSLDTTSAPSGLAPRDLAAFAPAFTLLQAQHGADGDRPSVWYLFRRTNDGGRTTNDE